MLVPIHAPAALLLIHVPANGLGKALEAWVPATRVGDQDEATDLSIAQS